MAAADNVAVFKFKSWRRKGVALPEVLEAYHSVDPELNVMPFCSQFIPMEVTTIIVLFSVSNGDHNCSLECQ